MFKGQAFDTFKLMIAAVIAVAILGIMLTIINSIIIPGQELPNAAPTLLSQVSNAIENVKSSGTKVKFIKNEVYNTEVYKSNSGGKTVNFVIADSLADNCELTDSDTKLEVISAFDSIVYACCDDEYCYLGVGTNDIC